MSRPMNRIATRFLIILVALIAALSIAPLPAHAGTGDAQELAAASMSTQTITSEAVGQTDATTKTVTVEWGIPAADSDPNKTIYSYLVSWGENDYTKKAVVPYGDGTVREYKIKGLKPDTTYKVRVGYRYQNNTGEGDTWINVPEWVTCEASTFTTGTTGPSGWGYEFLVSDDKGVGWFDMTVTAAPTTQYDGRYYEWAAMPGPKFKASKAEALFNGKYQENVVGDAYLKNWTGDLRLRWGEVPPKTGVVSVGIRSKLTGVGGPPDYAVYGAWRTKTLVADPWFDASWATGGAMRVTIPPLKHAQSYTIYVGKIKDSTVPNSEMKVTGWKKAATVGAVPGESVSAIIGKYGKTKLGQGGAWYGVKVVTHTKYGDSPGKYWTHWH